MCRRNALRRHIPAGERHAQIEKGTALFLDRLESGWIYHCYTLREHPVVVAGPDPRMLVGTVDPDDMRRAAAPIAELWLEQARNDPSGWRGCARGAARPSWC